jgi:hypothetical protein
MTILFYEAHFVCVLEARNGPLQEQPLDNSVLFKVRKFLRHNNSSSSALQNGIGFGFIADPDLAFYLDLDPDPGRQLMKIHADGSGPGCWSWLDFKVTKGNGPARLNSKPQKSLINENANF